MKKDVLFIALVPLNNEADGVANKVKMQARGIALNNRSVEILAYDKNGPALYEVIDGATCYVKSLANVNTVRWKSLFLNIKELLMEREYAKAYIRYPRCSRALIGALKTLSESGTNITLEIPTYPLHFDKPSNLRDFLIKVMYCFYELLYSPRLKKYVNGINAIGTVPDKIYGIPAKAIPNGVDEKAYKLRVPEPVDSEIHIVLSSNFYKHHGIDRLVTGLGRYLDSGKKDVYLELVGDGPEMGRIKRLTEDCNASDHVIFHGFKSGVEYDEIYNHCQVASSCLGFPRMGYPDCSPLKSREYMLRGIPYIYSYNEIGLDRDFKFAYNFTEIDGPIDIQKVVEFYETYKDNQHTVAKEMREYSLRTFAWKNILKDV